MVGQYTITCSHSHTQQNVSTCIQRVVNTFIFQMFIQYVFHCGCARLRHSEHEYLSFEITIVFRRALLFYKLIIWDHVQFRKVREWNMWRWCCCTCSGYRQYILVIVVCKSDIKMMYIDNRQQNCEYDTQSAPRWQNPRPFLDVLKTSFVVYAVHAL